MHCMYIYLLNVKKNFDLPRTNVCPWGYIILLRNKELYNTKV